MVLFHVISHKKLNSIYCFRIWNTRKMTVPDQNQDYGFEENATTDYPYYYDYDDDYYVDDNFTSGGLQLPKCLTAENVCKQTDFILKGDSDKVDLLDASDSAWIWTSFSVFTPLCILGIIGNILTIILFAKFIKKTTTSVFIIALAVVDLTVCSTSMPIWLFTVLNGNHDSEVLCKVDKLIYFLAIPISGGILLIISLDRFILIFLMKTKVMTTLRAKISILIMGLVCVAFAIPQTLSFSTMVPVDENLAKFTCENKKDILCHTNKCSQTTYYIPSDVTYYLFQSLMIIYVILVFVFVVLYSLIFCKVYTLYKKMARWRGRHSFHVTNVDIGHATFASESNGDSSSGDRSSRFTDLTTAGGGGEKMNDSPPPYVPKAPQPTIMVVKKKKRKPPHLQTALTLFSVTFCFVLAYAPMILMMFMGSCSGKEANSYVNICSRKDYRRFIWHFYFINHVTNPIIYSFMHPRFKESLKSCFRKFCKPCH